MEFIEPIANLLGLSPMMLVAISALFLVLVVVWYVLKFVVKLAWKVMAPGCALIAMIIVGLYIAGVVLTQ